MKEIGQITALKGDMAEVGIERPLTTGGGCCIAETWETVHIDVRNECGAGVGDYVGVISDYDRFNFRKSVRYLASAAAFVVGMGIGNYLWPALGISAWKDLLSFALGGVLTLAIFAMTGAVYRGRPAFIPGAYEVISPGRAAGLLRRARLRYAAFDTADTLPGIGDVEL
ncbi:MAG: SoxR reducing system RseC family protein [Treponema sp.]|jgi:hypothetical protein|nr:SoxR reducing system RseC family protein [Treponema sp.]